MSDFSDLRAGDVIMARAGRWQECRVLRVNDDGTLTVVPASAPTVFLREWIGLTAAEVCLDDRARWSRVFATYAVEGAMGADEFLAAFSAKGMSVSRAQVLGLLQGESGPGIADPRFDEEAAYAALKAGGGMARSLDPAAPPEADGGPWFRLYWNQLRMGGRDPAERPDIGWDDALAALGLTDAAEEAGDVSALEAAAEVRLPPGVRRFLSRAGVREAVIRAHPNNPRLVSAQRWEIRTDGPALGFSGALAMALVAPYSGGHCWWITWGPRRRGGTGRPPHRDRGGAPRRAEPGVLRLGPRRRGPLLGGPRRPHPGPPRGGMSLRRGAGRANKEVGRMTSQTEMDLGGGEDGGGALPELGLPLYGLRTWNLGGRILGLDVTPLGKLDLQIDGYSLSRFPTGSQDDSEALLSAARAEWKALRPAAREAIHRAKRILTTAMFEGQTWTLPAFYAQIRDHALLRRLATRLVWTGLDAEGQAVSHGRLTASGPWDLGPGRGSELPEAVVAVRLQPGEDLPEAVQASWSARFAAQPIPQLTLTDEITAAPSAQ